MLPFSEKRRVTLFLKLIFPTKVNFDEFNFLINSPVSYEKGEILELFISIHIARIKNFRGSQNNEKSENVMFIF